MAPADSGNAANAIAEAYAKRAFVALEVGNWKEAFEYSEVATDLDMHCALAYLGKLMSELHVHQKKDLENLTVPFDENEHYTYAIRFADEELKSFLQHCVQTINQRNNYNNRVQIYNSAKQTVHSATSVSSGKAEILRKAAELFERIPGFEDADELAIRYRNEANVEKKSEIYRSAMNLVAEAEKNSDNQFSLYRQAADLLMKVPGYLDADDYALQYQQKALEAEHTFKYEKAVQLMDEAQYAAVEEIEAYYSEAAKLLESISGYLDADNLAQQCPKLAVQCIYNNGRRIMNRASSSEANEQITLYEEAAKLFLSASGCSDADDLRLVCMQKVEHARNMAKFSALLSQMDNVANEPLKKQESAFRYLSTEFSYLGSFDGALLKAEECLEKAENACFLILAKAIENVPSQYRDTSERSARYKELGEKFGQLTRIPEVQQKVKECLEKAAKEDKIGFYNTAIKKKAKAKNAPLAEQEQLYREAADMFKACQMYDYKKLAADCTNMANNVTQKAYHAAGKYYHSGNYSQAYMIYKELGDYRDSALRLEKDINLLRVQEQAKFVCVGDHVVYGNYPQLTSNQSETQPISWSVLAVEKDAALIISDDILDAKAYESGSSKENNWDGSHINRWLNKSFLSMAFSSEEAEALLSMPMKDSQTDDSLGLSIIPFDGNESRIFLLSYDEALAYFPDAAARKSKSTIFAQMRGVNVATEYSWWRLRSLGNVRQGIRSVIVTAEGSFSYANSGNDAGGIRPAMWINLELAGNKGLRRIIQLPEDAYEIPYSATETESNIGIPSTQSTKSAISMEHPETISYYRLTEKTKTCPFDSADLVMGVVYPVATISGTVKKLNFYRCSSCGNIFLPANMGQIKLEEYDIKLLGYVSSNPVKVGKSCPSFKSQTPGLPVPL